MTRTRTVVVRAGVVVALTSACACAADRPASARETARLFYDAAAKGELDRARALLLPTARLHALERRFGSFASWASRATKNGTVARVEILDETAAPGSSRLHLLVLFNDGTRRHDHVVLVRTDDEWRIDAGSLPGARRRAQSSRCGHDTETRVPSRLGRSA
jgi:hypothetical protein